MEQPPSPVQPAPPPPVQTQPQYAPAAYPAETNSLAIVSLASGILSWFAAPVIGAVVAVVTGHMAKSQIRRTGEQGDTFATVGLILGYLHLAVVVLILGIIFLVLIGTFAWIRAASGG